MRVFPLLAVASLLAACGGGGQGGQGEEDGSSAGSQTDASATFTLTGTLASSAVASSARRAEERAGVSASSAVAEVTTVVAFSTYTSWWQAALSDGGSFSLHVDPSTPVALVFAGGSDQFLGRLALSGGLSFIPLNAMKVDGGVTSFDLGALTIVDGGFVAVNDPVADGGLIALSDDERAALLQASGLLDRLVQNPDVDGDGVVDLLADVYYRPFVMYFANGGSFGLDDLAPTLADSADLTGYRFCFCATNPKSYPEAVTFTGPPDSGLNGETNDQSPSISDGFASYGSIQVSDPVVPPAGSYTVGYDADAGVTLTFSVPDQSSATQYVALAVPTVTLNDGGTLQKIDWTYRLGGAGGSSDAGAIDPTTLVDQLVVQIDGDSTYACSSSGITAAQASGGRVYNSGELLPSVTEEVLACQNIPWSTVTRVCMAYNDVYGNHVVVTWNHATSQ